MAYNDAKQQAMAYCHMRRAAVAEQLHPTYLKHYWNLCAELNETYWAPYSGRRSFKNQLELWQRGRTHESISQGGRVVTNARPGDSAHNWGCATDWAEFRPEFVGQEIWNKANWQEFENAVHKSELVWGGDFKKLVDKPHCELPISVSWKLVGDIYRSEGVDVALAEIELRYEGAFK